MAKLTIAFAAALILLGITCYVETGSLHHTALIPAAEGLILLLAALLAFKPTLRMHAMHLAVTVALLCFIAGVVMMILDKPTGYKLADMLGITLLSGLFTALCVRSFIAARRARVSHNLTR